MVWGAKGTNGVGNLVFFDGKMNKMDYLNILKSNYVESAQKFHISDEFYIVQDNDPKHKSEILKTWLLYHAKKVLPHPPKSLDLCPLKHLLAYIAKKIAWVWNYHQNGPEKYATATMGKYTAEPYGKLSSFDESSTYCS